MMTASLPLPSLQTLPLEVAQSIFRHLNPISLICLSQTSTFFRRAINPGRDEFLERLLELECEAEFGSNLSSTCSIQNREQHQHAECSQDWSKMRWACARCVKLLTHIHFDYHSLLGRGYQKPSPESSAARPRTSWQPSQRAKKETQQQSSGMLAENCPSVGFKRYTRLCNECRYQTKKLGKRPASPGQNVNILATVPIQTSRKVPFGSSIDRFFPGYSDRLENKRPSFEIPVFHRFREEDPPFESYWTMYMVRCPGCETWKELRDFRVGEPLPHMSFSSIQNDPRLWSNSSFLDRDTLCNGCFAQANGQESLSVALLEWFRIIHDYELCISARHCTLGLSPVARTRTHPDFGLLRHEHRREIRHILAQGKRFNGQDSGLSHVSDMAYCRLMHTRIRELLGDIEKSCPEMGYLVSNEPFLQLWLDYFDELEAYWLWLKRTWDEVEQNPMVLVDWALKRDGASLI